MNFENSIVSGMNSLKNNEYPGRGIIMGISPDCKNFIQVYWIMGRSENSRNRIFVNESGFVKTEAFDPSQVVDPSLIIYYASRFLGQYHIISNGDQTDTIFNSLKNNGSFEEALDTRVYEPDAPNYTPRISGIIDLNTRQYKLSIIKSMENNPDYCVRQTFSYEKPVPGVGHCIHTYAKNGNPLPAFCGEPYPVRLFNDTRETLDFYWNILNKENRISLLSKYIKAGTGEMDIRIVNKNS